MLNIIPRERRWEYLEAVRQGVCKAGPMKEGDGTWNEQWNIAPLLRMVEDGYPELDKATGGRT